MRGLALLAAAALAAMGPVLPAAHAATCPEPVATCGAESNGGSFNGVLIVPGLHGKGGSGSSGGGGCTGCEWTMTPACMPNGPYNNWDAMCAGASMACASRGEEGIMMRIYMRTSPDSGWDLMGTACIGGEDDVLTMAELQVDAQRYVDQLDPDAAAIGQHPASRSVVNTRTYFSADGTGPISGTFGPAGVRMTISATPEYVWSWGDGSPGLTTTSTGGPYPAGDVFHTYRRPGTPTVTLTTRWTATFVVDTAFGQFGPFDVAGPPIAETSTRAVRVREGRAELVSPRG